MQAAELIKYIQNPQLLDKASVEALQKLVQDFPYFQPAHILLSMASKKWDASVYQKSLKKTAIVVSNRAHLFKLVHSLENQPVITSDIKEAVKVEPLVIAPPQETREETSAHELNILKAAEISVEPVVVPEEKPIVSEKVVKDPIAVFEKEIENQVVNAFVEKEILKTPELHHPKSKEDPESFVEWLSLLKKNNGQTYKQIEEQVNEEKSRHKTLKTPVPEVQKTVVPEKNSGASKKDKNRALIDKIIESSPGIIRNKEDQKFFTADTKAKESLLDNEHLVTETLAKIYALQGSVNKAVRAYEILSLKFPQKSAYFATLIQKLKNNP